MGLFEPDGRHRGRHGQAVIRPVVIHGLEDALAVAAAARSLDRRIDLITAAGASAYLGASMFHRIVGRIRQDTPAMIGGIFYDCAARRGDVLAGLRGGLTQFCLEADAHCPAILARAKLYAAEIIVRPMECLEPDYSRNLTRFLAEYCATN